MRNRKGRGGKTESRLPLSSFPQITAASTCSISVLRRVWESKSWCRQCRPLFTAVNILVEILSGIMQPRNQICSNLIVCVFPMFPLFMITSVRYKQSTAKGLDNSIHGRMPTHLLFWVHWSKIRKGNVFHVYLQNSNFTHLIIIIICVQLTNMPWRFHFQQSGKFFFFFWSTPTSIFPWKSLFYWWY